MKKYFLALLMLLGALAFSFAGCADSGKPSGDTGGTGSEETAPVSEAEWDAAFSRDAFKNVTADIKQTSGAESYSVQYKVDFGGDADLVLVRSVSGESTDTSLYAKKDGAEHSFALIDGKWSETDGQDKTANGVFEAFYAKLLPFAEQYENAEYDSETKLYDITFTIEGYTVTAKAGFASANLVSLSYSAEQDGMTGSAEIVLSDYEKTELTFPETDGDTPGGTEGDPSENPGGTEGGDPSENPGGSEGDPGDNPDVTPTKMSKEAWEKMLSPTSISYSLYLKSPSDESNLDYLYFKEGDSWYFRSENADAQYDRFYEYSKDGAWLYEQQEGGIWFRTPTKQYPSDIEYLFTFLKDDYDLFELGKDGVYTALLPAGALPGAYEDFAAETAVETDGQELHTVTITITVLGEEYMHRYSFTGEAQYTLPSADKIVDLITRTDWETALSADLFDNVTYTMTQGGGDDLFTVEMRRESKDGVLRIRHVNDPNNNPFLTFYEIEGDDAFSYTKSGENWVKNIATFKVGSVDDDAAMFFTLLLQDEYYSFSYDAESGDYTAENFPLTVFDNTTIVAEEIAVRFGGDKNPVSIRVRANGYTLKIAFSNVGSTSITDFPTQFIDGTIPVKMSEEEWQKAFNISFYTGADGKPNYTFESELINDDPAYSAFKMLVKYQSTENGSLVFCRDFDNAEQPEGTEQYSEEIDGKFYAYKLQDEKWIKTNAVSHFGGGVLEEMALIFAPYYDDFALSADGSYTAASVSIDMGGMYVDYINNRIVFDEGRISAIETTISMQAEGMKMEIPCRYTIYDVGNTVVTLPEADVDETLPDKMSEEEWEKAFDAELFKNLSYTLTTVSIEQDGSKSVLENTVQIIDEKDRMIARSSTVFDGEQNNDYYFVYLPADSGYTVYSYEKTFASAAGWSEYDKEGGEDPYYKTIAMFETFLKGSYDLLERSDDVTFTAAPEESGILSMTLTFEEGKITSFTLTMQEMSVSVQLTYGVSDKIELPEGSPQAEKA